MLTFGVCRKHQLPWQRFFEDLECSRGCQRPYSEPDQPLDGISYTPRIDALLRKLGDEDFGYVNSEMLKLGEAPTQEVLPLLEETARQNLELPARLQLINGVVERGDLPAPLIEALRAEYTPLEKVLLRSLDRALQALSTRKPLGLLKKDLQHISYHIQTADLSRLYYLIEEAEVKVE